MPEYRRFSDFSSPGDGHPLEGGKVQIEKVFNLEILITAYRIDKSKKNDGECLTVQFEIDGKKQVIFTGSEVLKNQLERYKDRIPFLTKIIKHSKYYTFS